MVRPSLSFLTACLAILLTCGASFAADTDAADSLPSVRKRFAGDDVSEVPDFQKHLGPLMGKLGCNGRACHGSFQGQGGFQLSLFGYDFDMDRKGLLDRIDLEDEENHAWRTTRRTGRGLSHEIFMSTVSPLPQRTQSSVRDILPSTAAFSSCFSPEKRFSVLGEGSA